MAGYSLKPAEDPQLYRERYKKKIKFMLPVLTAKIPKSSITNYYHWQSLPSQANRQHLPFFNVLDQLAT